MKISIIIPTYGRPVSIKNAINSLLLQEIEKYDTEILVIDNNTQNELADDLYSYCLSLKGKLRYIREPSPGLGAARHKGVQEAKGEILIFIDDDVEVSAGWINAIHKAFKDSKVGMVGGPSIPKFTSSIPAWFWNFVSETPYGGWMNSWLSLLDIGKTVKGISPNYIWGLNFSIRRELLLSCNGFHPDILPERFQRWQGDGETGLTMKVAEKGFRADYIHEAMLFHLCGPDRLTPDYFKKRSFYQGVCDSFTSIRAGNDPGMQNTRAKLVSIYRFLRNIIKNFYSKFCFQNPSWSKDNIKIMAMTEQAYIEGWRFHQKEVAADAALLSWVRRNDYWDADIRSEMK